MDKCTSASSCLILSNASLFSSSTCLSCSLVNLWAYQQERKTVYCTSDDKMNAHKRTHMHTGASARTHTHMQIQSCTHKHTRRHVGMWTCTQTRTHMCIHARKHTHSNTHTQILLLSLPFKHWYIQQPTWHSSANACSSKSNSSCRFFSCVSKSDNDWAAIAWSQQQQKKKKRERKEISDGRKWQDSFLWLFVLHPLLSKT